MIVDLPPSDRNDLHQPAGTAHRRAVERPNSRAMFEAAQ
jgi:hypothetical protein